MIKAINHSLRLLQHEKPEVVIGFGGHGSFAVVLAAALQGIPTMIHEQNFKPGRANKWLSRIVRKIAISFKGSSKYFKAGKVCTTGCPTHLRDHKKNKQDIYSNRQLSPDQKTILVFGGSQGAHRINMVFLQACRKLKEKLDFQVLHLSGERDYEQAASEYQQMGIRACVHSFLDQMEDAYLISDLVISRAGAVTITELALFQKKAILIPYPFAGAHQYENALELERTGMAEIIQDCDLTPSLLASRIEQAFCAHDETSAKREAGFLLTDASKRIADLALSLV